MPDYCSMCKSPLEPGARFCGECGAPAVLTETTSETAYIPLLELHTGMLGTRRSVAVMQVSTDKLLLFSLPEYFIDSVEELRERLDDTWLKVSDAGGDWNSTLSSWNWNSEDVVTGLLEVRDELIQDGKNVLVIKNVDIKSVFIERIESDTVWDIMTIDTSGKKYVIDLSGPVTWYAFTALKSVLGNRVECQEE